MDIIVLVIFSVCVSDPTETKAAGSKWRHQTELEEAVRWIGLPQGRGDKDKDHRLKIVFSSGISSSIVPNYYIILYFV